MTDLELVTKAANYAAKAHREHRRKDSAATPYVNHLTEVAYFLAMAGCTASVIAAGYLHDTIEDVDVTYEMLLDEFGEDIAALVLTVTDDKHLTKDERKQRQIDNAAHAPADTAALKLADKLSNLRSLVNAPPHGWNPERLTEYVDWAHRVIMNLPEPNPILLAQYELVRADLLRRWS